MFNQGFSLRNAIGLDPATDPLTDPANPAPAGKTFTEDEVNRLLSRERDRLHGRLTKSDDTTAAMRAELDALKESDAARARAERKAVKDAEDAARRASDAELSAKELIDRRTTELQQQYEAQQSEWASRYTSLEQTMAQREALFEKERQFQELATYATAQVNARAEDIAPELIDYVGGNSREEIDASIERAVAKTAQILAGIQGAQQATRAQMPGVSTGGFTSTGPMETQGSTRMLGPDDIKAMDMTDFAANRAALGVTGNNVGQGRFGYLGKGLYG